MQIDHYLRQYDQFHADCGHSATPAECLKKHYEECCEFIKAYESGIVSDIMDELADTLNTGIYAAHKSGMSDPLHFGWRKLQRTREKYRKKGLTTP